MAETAESYARFLLKLASEEPEAELITQMRLHKLLYYVQGWSLASRGQPAFSEEIQAWTHGPVVRDLYSRFAQYKNTAIDVDREKSEGDDFKPEVKAFVRSVWEHYKQFSASQLRRMTHQEEPFREVWGDRPDGVKGSDPIPIERIAAYFEGERQSISDSLFDLDKLRQAEEDLLSGGGRRLDEVIAAEGWFA